MEGQTALRATKFDHSVYVLGAMVAAVLVLEFLDLLLRISDFSRFGPWFLPIVILAGVAGGLVAWRRSRPPAVNRTVESRKPEMPLLLPTRRIDTRFRDSDLSTGITNSLR